MAQLEVKELPEGLSEDEVVKPVKLAHELNIAPQIVYGWIRTGGLQSYSKNGEGRYLVREEVKAWQEAKEQRKAEREAAKAEKAAKKAAKAEEGDSEDETSDEKAEDYAG